LKLSVCDGTRNFGVVNTHSPSLPHCGTQTEQANMNVDDPFVTRPTIASISAGFIVSCGGRPTARVQQ
jgi:hypothetical protein